MLVRVRQVLSITETQYNEETIVFVAPDSTILSVLQAALLGIDLRDHWALAYQCVALHHFLACAPACATETYCAEVRGRCTTHLHAILVHRALSRGGSCRPAEMRTVALNPNMQRDDSPMQIACERPPACL